MALADREPTDPLANPNKPSFLASLATTQIDLSNDENELYVSEVERLRIAATRHIIEVINRDGFYTRKTYPKAYSRDKTEVVIKTDSGPRYHVDFFKIKWHYRQSRGHEGLHLYVLPHHCHPFPDSGFTMSTTVQTAINSPTHELFQPDALTYEWVHFEFHIRGPNSEYRNHLSEVEKIIFLNDLLTASADEEQTKALYDNTISYKDDDTGYDHDEIGWMRDIIGANRLPPS